MKSCVSTSLSLQTFLSMAEQLTEIVAGLGDAL